MNFNFTSHDITCVLGVHEKPYVITQYCVLLIFQIFPEFGQPKFPVIRMCEYAYTSHRDRLQLTTKRNNHVEVQIEKVTVEVVPDCFEFGSSVCELDNRPDGEGDFFFNLHLCGGHVKCRHSFLKYF